MKAWTCPRRAWAWCSAAVAACESTCSDWGASSASGPGSGRCCTRCARRRRRRAASASGGASTTRTRGRRGVLTRDLLPFRVRQGVLRPAYVKRDDEALLGFAQELLAEMEASRGVMLDDVEESLGLK